MMPIMSLGIRIQESGIFSPQTRAPATLTLGSIFWKVVVWAIDLDFLLAIQDEQIANVLDAIIQHIWWICLVGGLLWWWERYRKRETKDKAPSFIETLFSFGLVFFVIGTIVTAKYVSGNPPLILATYRSFEPVARCAATINSGILRNYSEDYYFILICGPVDDETDEVFDERAVFSKPRVLDSNQMAVTAVLTQDEYIIMRSYGTWWIRASVIQKDIDPDQYSSIEDFQAVGGIVFEHETPEMGFLRTK